MENAMLIYNPSSGDELAGEYYLDITEAIEQKGYQLEVRETEKSGDATSFAADACRQMFDLVVAVGGDGTINEVINGLAEQRHQPLFTFIPFGTVNDFARAIGMPMDPDKAIAYLKEADTEQRVDIGKVNDHYFVNVIAVGAIAEATYDVSPEQKTRFGALSYYIEGAKKVTENNSYPIRLTLPHQEIEEQAFLVIIGMTNSIAGFEKLSLEAELDDGLMHVFIVKELKGLDIVRIISSAMTGTFSEQDQVIYIKTNYARLSSKVKLHTNIDGDEGEDLPIELNVLKKHIRLLRCHEK